MQLTINNLITLNNKSVKIGILPNAEGFGLPESKAQYTDLAYAEKMGLQSNRLTKREIKLQCVITEGNFNDYFELRDLLQQQLYIKDGLTDFTLTTFETPARSFNFSGVAKINLPLHRTTHGSFDLEITCPDPFFYAETAVTGSLNFTQAGIFIPFYIPDYLGGAGNNILIINNLGNYKTFCDITITGPGKNFTITNQTTMKTTNLGFYLNDFTLGVSRQVTIYGNNKRVIGDGGSNRYNFLSSFEALELLPGNNTLVFTAESGNGLATAGAVSFLPRFTHI